jgi:hypothetical protein
MTAKPHAAETRMLGNERRHRRTELNERVNERVHQAISSGRKPGN